VNRMAVSAGASVAGDSVETEAACGDETGASVGLEAGAHPAKSSVMSKVKSRVLRNILYSPHYDLVLLQIKIPSR